MHSLKAVMLIVCILALASFAVAANNPLGIHDTGRVIFHSPTRVGGSLLPPGEYIVHHTMEGQEHVMVFQAADHKGSQEVKVKHNKGGISYGRLNDAWDPFPITFPLPWVQMSSN